MRRRAKIIRHPALVEAQARTARRIRRVLIALTLFLGVTALQGGLFVVPDLPPQWFSGTPFASAMVPAIALAAVGLSSLLAAGLLALRPEVGAPVSFVTGLAIATFEVVQVLTISLGDWLRPLGLHLGHRVLADGDPFGAALWLQPFYFALGLLIAALAWRVLPPWFIDQLRAFAGLPARNSDETS